MTEQLPKKERMNSKKQIDRLFRGGAEKAMSQFPLRMVYMVDEVASDSREPLAQMMVSVPKRFCKHAVDRNRVKRLVREAYRRNKAVLVDSIEAGTQRRQVSVCFIWTDSKLRSYEDVEAKTANLLQRLAEKLGNEGE